MATKPSSIGRKYHGKNQAPFALVRTARRFLPGFTSAIGLIALLFVVAGCGKPAETPAATTVLPVPTAPMQSPSLSSHRGPDIPDRLVVPAIHIDTPVVELGWHAAMSNDQVLSEWDVAKYAAGWHKNSAYLGQKGNVVMSGHNNIYGAVFRELDQLKKGDEAVVWSGNRQYIYHVDQVIIVPEKYASADQRAANARWIGPFADNRLTLVSCWPRDDNTHRIIIIAHQEEGDRVIGN